MLDKSVLPISAMMECISELEGVIAEEQWGMSMSVEEITIDLPAEFDIMQDDMGRLVLGAAPPTQRIETTFMPVFHRLTLTIANATYGND